MKFLPYTLVCRSCLIVSYKHLRQAPEEEFRVTFHQRGYPATLTNKEFELAGKIPFEKRNN